MGVRRRGALMDDAVGLAIEHVVARLERCVVPRALRRLGQDIACSSEGMASLEIGLVGGIGPPHSLGTRDDLQVTFEGVRWSNVGGLAPVLHGEIPVG